MSEGKNDNLHRVLMVCTSVETSSWGTKTGIWFEELSTPYYLFKDAGFAVDICSISGTIAVDPACWTSDYFPPESQEKFIADAEAQAKYNSAPSIETIVSGDKENMKLGHYGCIFLCGGHGCIDDFLNNPSLRRAIEYVYNNTKGCVASVCHGAIGLIGCRNEKDQKLLNSKFVAVFSNEEEGLLGLQGVIPVQIEDLVDDEGAICVPSKPWTPNAVVDGRLATGQNPQSSVEACQRALDILRSLGGQFSPILNENKPWGK